MTSETILSTHPAAASGTGTVAHAVDALLLCAQECERHAGMHEHCRVCAEACRACETACRELLEAR